MRKVYVLMLTILAMSLFESVSIVPTMGVKSARKPERFYWDVTLVTSMGSISRTTI